jgi:glyoxylase I family protein
MRVLGICFAGSSTDRRDEMKLFLSSVLGASLADVAGAAVDMFAFPDGSTFALGSRGEMGADRSIGFLVEDLDVALGELSAAGVETDIPATNDLYRYVHFVAPDGNVYELMERVRGSGSGGDQR